MERRTNMIFPMISSLTEDGIRTKPLAWRMGKVLTWFLFTIFLLIFSAAGGLAEEKDKKEEQLTLEEISVTGVPYTNPVTPINTRYGTQYNLVTEEQIKQQDSHDFHSALENVPGVMFQKKNLLGDQTSHSLYIRGRGASHPSSDFSILFDGAPRYGGIFGQVLGDSIAVSTIGGIEVYKSPQPSQFGSGYASVNVLPKYMAQEGQEVVLNASGGSYATFDESLSGGIKRGPYDAYVSQSWVSTDGHRDHSRAQQQNYYANGGYQISKEWNVRLLANYVNSQTLAPMPDTTPTATNGVSWPGAERYDTETFFTTLTLNHQYQLFEGYLKGYWDETDFDLLQELNNGQRYGNGTGGLWSRQDISLYGVRAREKLHLWSGGEILAGFDLDMTELKNTQRTYSGLAVPGINGGRAERVWDYPDTTLFSPYLAISQMIGRSESFHLIPSAGYRYFYHNEFEDKSSYQAGLVMGYGHTDLNFNYARGVNYPTPVVLMNFVLTNAPVTNASQYWEKIKPETVDHYEVGLTHTWPKLASLGATAFYDKGKDRFQAYMFGPIPIQFNDPTGEYEIRGLELTGTVTPVKKLEFFAAATWLDAKATGNNGIEVDHLPYTPSFQFQAGGKWTFLRNFQLYADMQYLHDLYQGTDVRSGTLNFTDPGSVNKLGDITLVNARLSYLFDYAPWHMKASEVFVAVNNIFNQDYEYAKGYPMPGTTVFAGFIMKFQ
jgi:outer membrane cobalamin receptor